MSASTAFCLHDTKNFLVPVETRNGTSTVEVHREALVVHRPLLNDYIPMVAMKAMAGKGKIFILHNTFMLLIESYLDIQVNINETDMMVTAIVRIHVIEIVK